MDILLQEMSLKTLKIPSGLSYSILYNSHKCEVREGAEGALIRVRMSLGTRRVPQPSAEARRRVAIGHLNPLVKVKILQSN